MGEWIRLTMSTGIFFHYQQGERLRDFPQALDRLLSKNNVLFYDAFYPSKPRSSFDLEPIPTEILLKVHSPDMVQSVKASGAFEGALYSAAGTLSAANRICSGELKNAFVFTGYGDHHAGSDFFGGGCYLNGAAIAIEELRENQKIKRFAIIDTDAHHGDGSWELFSGRREVLYICFCSEPSREANGNVNVHIPFRAEDERYIHIARSTFNKWIKPFSPEIIFWNWGYDGTVGEYGDLGLSPAFHVRLALAIREVAEEVSKGRLVVVLCGGSRRDLAFQIIPRVIEVLINKSFPLNSMAQ
jgi:acetoin utilization deacetylase AcuC-like enzyme